MKTERGYKEPKRYILPWALLGFVVVMIYQMVASLITMWLVGQPQQSPNTERIMAIAKQPSSFHIINLNSWPNSRGIHI